ncbi:ProQ/FINO family protein, partial [Salmonella enterica subsp. diarizonae]
ARYVRCVMAGGARYDLNGEPCGEVTEAAVKACDRKSESPGKKIQGEP